MLCSIVIFAPRHCR